MVIDNVKKQIRHSALSKGGGSHEITVGGSVSDKFYPHVNLNVWGEDDLAIEFPELPVNFTENVDVNGRLRLATAFVDVDIYMLDQSRIEFSAILKVKPPKNYFSFSLTGWENFYFAKQSDGSLNPGATLVKIDNQDYWKWEDAFGVNHMPSTMCGGYVVYHKTKKNGKYLTGQCFTFTRPLFIDANNNTTWGTIDIINGTMTVTAPASWLNTAAYPVIIDPDFGYSTIGINTQTTGTAFSYAGNNPLDQYTAGSGEQIDTISFYGMATAGTQAVDVGIYDVTGVTPVNKLVASTVTVTTTAGWQTTASLAQAMVNGTKYTAAFNNMGTTNLTYYYNNDASVSDSYDSGLGLPATWVQAGTGFRRYSVYASYSAGGTTWLTTNFWWDNI